MKSLLWKEWREKKLWGLPLIASTQGVLLLGTGYTFCGNFDNVSIAISIFVALIFGASSFASEMKGDTTDFLYSRSASWKKIIIAKLTIGIGIIIAVSILAAITYRFTCPAPYVKFATLPALCKGIWLALLVMGIPYLTGFVCSVVLPGIVGSFLIMIIAAIGSGLEISLVFPSKWGNYVPHQIFTLYFSGISWLVFLMCASILTIRFGLTLDLRTRVKRFAFIVLCGVIITNIVAYIVFVKAEIYKFGPERVIGGMVLSPDGKYLATRQCDLYEDTDRYNLKLDYYIYNLETNKKVKIYSGSFTRSNPIWVSNNTLYYTENVMKTYNTKYKQQILMLSVVQVNQNLKLHKRLIDIQGKIPDTMKPSSDGHKVMLIKKEDRITFNIDIVDIDKGIIIKSLTQKDSIGAPWWQSDNQIGFLDKDRKRQIISITN